MRKSTKIILGILYWLVHLTWGALLTLPGLLSALIACVWFNGKAHKNGFGFIVEIGGNWGGLNLGAVSFCGQYYGTDYWDEIRSHEFGHSLFPQALLLGPFHVFIVAIPSAIRYWYYIIATKRGKEFEEDWYYKFWAESNASSNGEKWIKKIESK